MNVEVSIILCSYNRAEHLERTLQSLREVNVPVGFTTELLLVDNASTDATLEVMRTFDHPEMEVRVVREEKRGLSSARNRGVSEARGSVLLFTDDDVRVPDRWIGRMCRPILNGDAHAVAGGVEIAKSLRREWMTPQHRTLLASTEQIDPEDPDRLVGANMAIAKKVFKEIPGFNPELGPGQLGLGGETLLSWQMLAKNLEIEAAFDVTVEHKPDPERLARESFREMARKNGRSQGYINYHWRGHTEWSVPKLLIGIIIFNVKLAWYRARSILPQENRGRIDVEEMNIIKRIHRAKQHIKEKIKQLK